MRNDDQPAWYLAQLVAGLKPDGVNPARFEGPYTEAYAAYLSGNGRGPKALQSWLAQPGREAIRRAVAAYGPGAPMPAAPRIRQTADQAAWYIRQIMAGLRPPPGVDPARFEGQYLKAYTIFQGGNGHGATALQAWLAQPGRESIRRSVMAYRPGSAMPPAEHYDYHLTDLGNAERFADQHADHLRFVREWGWMYYKDGRWQIDPGAAKEMATLTIRRIYGEAENVEDGDRRKELIAWAFKSEASPRIKAMLELAESQPSVRANTKEFDRDPYLLNCQNGTVGLQTGRLREHRASDMLTRMAPCDYDPDAKALTWLGFLESIFARNQALINFVQRAIGYSLTGETREQVMFLCHGQGSNGKSTLLEILRAVLGDYGQQADPSTFLVRNSDSIRNDIARMVGVRFASAIEVGEGRRLNETLIKQVTGQDTLTARFLHKEYFEFKPQFKLWMAANHKPIIRGTDEAIWRRMRLIPFEVTFRQGKRDSKLTGKLLAELPGILAWAVKGCRQWQKDGLKEPEAVLIATNEYRGEMDVLAGFIEECCIVKQEARVTVGDLYRAYKHWAEVNGENAESQRKFGRRVGERGFDSNKSNGVRLYLGLGLISERNDD